MHQGVREDVLSECMGSAAVSYSIESAPHLLQRHIASLPCTIWSVPPGVCVAAEGQVACADTLYNAFVILCGKILDYNLQLDYSYSQDPVWRLNGAAAAQYSHHIAPSLQHNSLLATLKANTLHTPTLTQTNTHIAITLHKLHVQTPLHKLHNKWHAIEFLAACLIEYVKPKLLAQYMHNNTHLHKTHATDLLQQVTAIPTHTLQRIITTDAKVIEEQLLKQERSQTTFDLFAKVTRALAPELRSVPRPLHAMFSKF
jgi:hypothetical protein